MSVSTDPVVVDPNAVPPVAAPGAAAAASSSSSGDPGYSMNTRISSLEDLQKKAPKVYNAMMQGIASSIIDEMKEHQNEIHKMNLEAQQQLESNK